MLPHQVLKNYFGYDCFRSGQEELIADILKRQDVLGIMPTGAGKSLCFQIPALMFDGITLIISPLISLMKDQVRALTQAGVQAAYINSSLTEEELYITMLNAQKGVYKLIYVAPERLLTARFLSFAKSVCIDMLTVDEGHCISQWGQDFRPSYAKIPDFIDLLPQRPIVSAFTATATPRVREDIIALLRLQHPTVLVTGFDRQNLYFGVQKSTDRFTALIDFLHDKRGASGIVYCSTRAAVEEVCGRLQQNKYNASRYHAGLSDSERKENQDAFLYDRVHIMVATNAFGMGIDKSNVSFVVHYNMPKDIESYYQEAGRAGRDGEKAECLLLYSGQDVRTHNWLIEHGHEGEYPDQETEDMLKERERKRLREMTFYCTTSDCLRSYMLTYFGEQPSNFCGNCSNCLGNFETADITIDAQKILSCVVRMKEHYGITMLIDVLRGSKNEKVLRLGFNTLSTYGICEQGEKKLRHIIDYLILNGFLCKSDTEYPVITLGKHARDVLFDGKIVHMQVLKENEKPTVKSECRLSVEPINEKLLDSLKKLRLEIARIQKVPAFIIFSDNTLADICKKLPTTRDAFLMVSGVGGIKCDRYGELFLDIVRSFVHE